MSRKVKRPPFSRCADGVMRTTVNIAVRFTEAEYDALVAAAAAEGVTPHSLFLSWCKIGMVLDLESKKQKRRG